jgi:2-polyprenyl-3-methyl-5-hydroxy-6-metoxy-1,4-benzoquinol methylase
MTDEMIKNFYTLNVRTEWRRLVMDAYHRLEFETTLFYFERYLPKQGSILDAGCGPGRYTIELARQGYDVSLLDATQANLDFAKRQVIRHHLHHRVKDITCGSIIDLSMYPEASFDAVICTGGPLSHILDAVQRDKAISELIRVSKPGAPIFVSVMSLFGVLVEILESSQLEITEPHFKLLCETGDYLGGYGFTACHFFLPEELLSVFTRAGIQILQMAGLEGISSQHTKEINHLAEDKERFDIWLETHYQTCTHPAIVGISEHMLMICRKEM